MDVNRFLLQHFPKSAKLTSADLRAISDFTLMWSAFENQVCETHATPNALRDIPKRLAERGLLDLEPFGEALAYFRDRYFKEGRLSDHFTYLRLHEGSPEWCAAYVEKAVTGLEKDPATVLTGILLIVHRYRNNLFHGEKWKYGIVGQRENFGHACTVLMAVMARLSDAQ